MPFEVEPTSSPAENEPSNKLDVVVLDLKGRLDSTTAFLLEVALQNLITAGRYQIVLSLPMLGFMSNQGIRVISRAIDQIKQQAGSTPLVGDIRLAGPATPKVERVLELSGANTFLQLFPDPGLAAQSFLSA